MVPSTTLPRMPRDLIHSPTQRSLSDTPSSLWPYTRAVSRKLPPISAYMSIMRKASSCACEVPMGAVPRQMTAA